MTQLEGVSPFTFYERFDNYLEQFGGKSDGTPERNRRRGEVYDLAHDTAVAEMLDEIHIMLRHLLQSTRNG